MKHKYGDHTYVILCPNWDIFESKEDDIASYGSSCSSLSSSCFPSLFIHFIVEYLLCARYCVGP